MTNTKYLRAVLVTGQVVIAAFQKLSGTGQNYVSQVFSGRKPLNVWTKVSTVHPKSGEAVLFRTREMIGAAAIRSISAVKPKAGFEAEDVHQFDPTNFEAVVEMQAGENGTYTVPAEQTPEGLTAGDQYPIHREPNDLRRYIVTKVAAGDVPEQRYFIDSLAPRPYAESEAAESRHTSSYGPSDSDDDDSF